MGQLFEHKQPTFERVYYRKDRTFASAIWVDWPFSGKGGGGYFRRAYIMNFAVTSSTSFPGSLLGNEVVTSRGAINYAAQTVWDSLGYALLVWVCGRGSDHLSINETYRKIQSGGATSFAIFCKII